jgi:hypothetical protein
LALAIIVAGVFVTLVVVHAAWFAYAITAVVAVGLFLASAIAGWRRRQPDHDHWRSESLGHAWRDNEASPVDRPPRSLIKAAAAAASGLALAMRRTRQCGSAKRTCS